MSGFGAFDLGLDGPWVPGGGRRRSIDMEALNNRVCNSAAELDQAFNDFFDASQIEVQTLIRKVLWDAYASLTGTGLDVGDVKAPPTPRDTGRARAGWMIGSGTSEDVPPPGTYSQSQIDASVHSAMSALPTSDVYYLYNNVEYLLELENGHSQQAPAGFIALTLQAMASELDQLVAQRNGA